jgi:hypothetical protein
MQKKIHYLAAFIIDKEPQRASDGLAHNTTTQGVRF